MSLSSTLNTNSTTKRFKLLLVEDHRAIREVGEATLRLVGPFEVDSTYDAHRAVEMVMRRDYDAVLMDLRLPDLKGQTKAGEMLGIQAMHRIREFSDVPIVVTTAYGDAKTKRAAQEAGATVFKTKPIDWHQLAGQLVGLIERRVVTRAVLEEHFEGVTLSASSGTDSGSGGPTAFCSYADEDVEYLLRLDTYLKPLDRQGALKLWHNQDILPGEDREAQMRIYLSTADLILTLVSPDYLGSDVSYAERWVAVERHKRGEAVVVPILIRPADWRNSLLGELAPLPASGKPVTTWANKDEAWLQIVEGVRFVVGRLKT